MKITKTPAQRVEGVYRQNSPRRAEEKRSVAKDRDGLSISTEAKEMARLQKELSQIPELRLEKVEKIRQQLQSGSYQASAGDVAAKILEGWQKG